MRRRLLAALSTLALLVPASAAIAAQPADGDPASRFGRTGDRGPIGTSFVPASLDPSQRVAVIVEMTGDPVAVVQADAGRELSPEEEASVQSSLETAQEPVVAAIEDVGGSVDATMQSAYNGIQASVSSGDVADIAALPGVVAVRPAPVYTIDNAESVPFLGIPQVWQDTGFTGQNVKVAIIDTGIDYTHADFGGPGTVEAYEEAAATSTAPADPTLFGPEAPRVKGGIDLVGDAYDGADPDSVPQPDDNPLDCEGHGSHVAGTAAGGGVTAEGDSYAGPYDASSPERSWTIGPGVAPQADLYAIRVFGCTGSTNVVVPAIDWAVENHMDVINMSLGSDYGRADSPDAVAASNAVGAGVVVVASAGNAGPNPYLAGSPATGAGVISVAAIDSIASFPGASVTVDGVPVPAIDANGADLSGLGDLTVVRLVDDPSTPSENEALGCSVAAYSFNGVKAGLGQLAVSSRGVCARAAKAVFAQQAGAAVALMVNNADGFPPYEGPILANPDTGEPYTVTIPFLGVRSSDGSAFTTGAEATVAPETLDNPTFRANASFSSNGPRSGDSGIAVDVAAPGVSIVSAGVGTGNGTSTESGTSMSAPHVAGVAALTREAHPDWSAADIASAVVSTADPDGVADEELTRDGVGLVDAAQAVATQVTATGDAFRTDQGWRREPALDFGFVESPFGFLGAKAVTVTNHGTQDVTYQVSVEPSAQSANGRVRVSQDQVTVPAGGSARVVVYLAVGAGALPGSTGDDQYALHQFSGDVAFTADGSELRVPYLMVARPDSRVSTSTSSLFGSKPVTDATRTVSLRNVFGGIDGTADFYTWGLSDPKDLPAGTVDTGFDLASVGVQSFDTDDGLALVFAVNTHHRWSNAAEIEFDIPVDLDGDGETDATLSAVDQGLLAGAPNGVSAVYVTTAAGTSSAGFLAAAPTDSSTILIPVLASDLGWTGGAFRYTAVATSITTEASDEIATNGEPTLAAYDPDEPAISNGQFVTVAKNRSASQPVVVDAAAVAAQQPLGTMVVAIDNRAGTSETLLIPLQR